MTGGSLTASGGGGNGIQAGDSSTVGTIRLTDVTINVLGSGGGSAVIISNNTDSTATLTDVTIAVSGPGGGNFGIRVTNGATVTGGNGTLLLNQTNNPASILNLNATNNVILTGDVDAKGSAGTTNINLFASSTLTGAINSNSLTGASGINPAEPITGLPLKNVNVSINANSVWNMRSSSTVGTLYVAPGAQVNFTHITSSFSTLVVNKLVGAGGIFTMGVDLGQQRSDYLLIQGSSEGQHFLSLVNRNPNSDLPENTAQLLVSTPDGIASFKGGIEGGTFKYSVVRGDGSGTTPNVDDWYLTRANEITPTSPTILILETLSERESHGRW